MRRFFLIVMIALLPVRGWASDMMTVSMLAQQLHAVQSAQSGIDGQNASAQPVAQVQPTMSADCPMMAMLAGDRVRKANDETGSPVFKVCTTCQLCMGLVTGFSQLHPPLMPLPRAALLLGSVSFTSAERASGCKPPIS